MRIDRMAAMLLMILLVVAVVTITGCPKPTDTENPDNPATYEVTPEPEPTADEEATEATVEGDEESTEEATETDEEATEGDEEATEEPTEEADAGTDDWVTTDSGLKILDTEVGDGAEAVAGTTVFVLYRGTTEDGVVFDESARHGNVPIDFPLGAGRVIPGWDEGIAGMKVGGKRSLEIPTELAYSSGELAGKTLLFDCELVDVK